MAVTAARKQSWARFSWCRIPRRRRWAIWTGTVGRSLHPYAVGSSEVAADVDADGTVEFVAGDGVYE